MKQAYFTLPITFFSRLMLGSSLAMGLGAFAAAQVPVVKVAVATVEPAAQNSELAVTGDLVSVHTTVVAAEVEGIVTSIEVESGDRAELGTVLAIIREKPAQLQLAALRATYREAEARVELAMINERRLRGLVDKKSVSRNDYDTASAELAQANATLARRKAEADEQADALDRHRVRAPFAGTVLRRDIEVGQWLSVGESTFVLDDLSVLRAVLAVPQDYFGRIRPGAPVELRVDALPARPFSAAISRVVPGVNRAGRTFDVWVDVDNANGNIAPGMSVRARIEVASSQQVDWVSVPRDAVVKIANGSARVWRLNGTAAPLTVSAVAVRIENAVADDLIVEAPGLQTGDRLVVRGNESLREGAAVAIVPTRQ